MIPALTRLLAFARFAWLTAIVCSWADHEQPWRDHTELAAKIAYVAIASPIFDASIDPLSLGSAAHLTSTVEDESSFGARIVGDGGRSHGVAQIWMRPDLEHDDVANLIEASRQIRISFAMCGDYRAYFAGVCTHSTHVQWMSDRRVKRARGFVALLQGGEEVAVRK